MERLYRMNTGSKNGYKHGINNTPLVDLVVITMNHKAYHTIQKKS